MHCAEQGLQHVKQAAENVRKSQASELLYPLDGAYSWQAYPQYFLAIDGMRELYSINAVQALVRNLIGGRTITDAVEESTGRSWDAFQKDIREYSLKIFTQYARPDLE